MSDATPYDDHPVRPYVLTNGRVHPSRNVLRPETLLRNAGQPTPMSANRQQRTLLDLCQGVLSLAEAAVYLGQPVSLVAVIASDLVDSGHLVIHSAAPRSDVPHRAILEKVLDGLYQL
ncbi:DUF742 domain-containing protein [Saccharopolyspora rosea]|uniref:DUF742 domain-containing protein n=1 Tax=Saccharopolyspora rosea TaxID=524884 RepID=A0ABW3FRW9_9PSEU|nr:DUF742 domain-containing protein [Saccharopolyspora rosea]